jgi:predicted AlkP superfamily pyrophosphatase or phosphodiesterase
MVNRSALLALALAAASCAAPPDPPRPMSSRAPEEPRHVVIISIDGLQASVLDDPRAHLPTIRRLRREGAAAEGLKCSFPSMTWPCHTTLATGVEPGRHGVFGNNYLDRSTGKTVDLIPDPVFDKDEIVKVPTVYDVAFKAGLKTAAVIWPASRNAKTLHWTVPDVKTKELFLKYGTPEWLEELRREGLFVDMQEVWCGRAGGGVQRDWMYARAAAQLIREHRPNLLLLHLVEVDHALHAYGPGSPDALWAASYADDRVRDVVEAVEASGLRDRTAIFVLSDHGFAGYTRTIHPNVHLRKSGLLTIEAGKPSTRQAYALPQGGACFLYALDRDRRATILQNLKAKFRSQEGVQAVFEEKDFPSLGLSTPDQDPRMPDLILAAREGYTFSDATTGDNLVTSGPALKGSHGHLPSEPGLRGVLVAWGAGIRPGARLPLANAVDVAPTAARLLGLRMENVDGRVLEEMLR